MFTRGPLGSPRRTCGALACAALACGGLALGACTLAVDCTKDDECPAGTRCTSGACKVANEGEGEAGEGEGAEGEGAEGEGAEGEGAEGEDAEGEGEVGEGEGEAGEGEGDAPPRLLEGGLASLHARSPIVTGVLLDERFEAHPPLCDVAGRCVTGGFTP